MRIENAFAAGHRRTLAMAQPAAPTVELSVALSLNPRTAPIFDGRVQPEGIRLVPSLVDPSEMFWRQLKYGDFDVSEMSLSSLSIAASHGPTDWVAIPVFTYRDFFHTRILVRANAGIESPADLRGKRVGVPEYQQTAAIWSRGVLEHEFGVHARDIDWYMERTPEKSHGGSTGFTPPPGVRFSYLSPGTDIGAELLAERLDATLLYLRDRNLIDRSRADLDASPAIRPLFRDRGAEGRRYFAKTGIFPINHGMVLRRSLVERYPWLPLNLYSAFLRAKELALETSVQALEPYFKTGLLDGAAQAALREDPLAYGLKASRPVVETVARYAHEQGLAARIVTVEELFAPSTLDL
jgi:4,5-dihydroxyphthalate decarboxylase